MVLSYRLLSLSILAIAASAHAQYHITTMNTPGTDATYVLDINDSERWAGYATTAYPLSPVGYLEVGVTGNADGTGIATFDRGGPASGTFSIGASGINAAGDVSGASVSTAFAVTGFTRTAAGAYADVSPTGAGITSAYSEAVDLNDHGTVVGYYDETVPTAAELDSGSISHGFILQGGVYTAVDHAGGHGTQLYSVNDAGTATGRYLDASEQSHGFLYDSATGVFDDLALSGFDDYEFDGLNGNGDFTAIGYVTTPFGRVPFSFLHTATGFTPFAVPGALATVAYGLNDGGQVVGVYVTSDLAYHGFVATPVPEPASLAALGLGALALLRRRKA